MKFIFRRLSQSDVDSIRTWRYDAPYTMYDGRSFASAIRIILWLRWFLPFLGDHYAVDNEYGDLIGFFSFYQRPYNVVGISLGLRPDLTGQGHGLAFVQAGMIIGKHLYAPATFQLTVASFNTRAMKVYTRAGFKFVKTGGAYWHMARNA